MCQARLKKEARGWVFPKTGQAADALRIPRSTRAWSHLDAWNKIEPHIENTSRQLGSQPHAIEANWVRGFAIGE